jgi:S1-C subfamily serine protease
MEAMGYRRILPWETAGRRVDSVAPRIQPGKWYTGTGFVAGPKGTIVTAYHVVEGARTVHVTLSSGRQGIARVARRNEAADLAVLEFWQETPDYLTLGTGADVRIGQPVWTLGYPVVGLLGLDPKFTDGSVSALSGINGASEVYQVTVPIQPGNSGGPLVTDNGTVIGVMTSSAAELPFFKATGALPQGVNWAVKSDLAKGFFDAPPEMPKAASREEAVERVRKAICFIEAIHGDGIPDPPTGFGAKLSPKSVTTTAFDGLRARCDRSDGEACLSVARVLVSDCKASNEGACADARTARTLLAHACATGRNLACDTLRENAR